MSSESSGRLGKTRALLLGVLVILATVAVISTFTGNDPVDETVVTTEFVDEGVVEVSPLIPSKAITSASWRDEDDPRQAAVDGEDVDEGESTSLFDGVDFGDDGDKRRRYEKSVEETVKDIEGLGVFVAPETEIDKPKKKKR